MNIDAELNIKSSELAESKLSSEKKIIDKVNIVDLNQYLLSNKISNNYIQPITSFELVLDNSCEIIIEELLRVLPNRRLVFYGRVKDGHKNSQKIILKIFIDSQKCSKDYKKLLANYNLLLRHGLPTPLVIFSNLLPGNLSYFVYEYINSEYDKDATYSNHKLIINAIAKLHRLNIYQTDLHLDNFIINKSKVYYLDLQSLEYGFAVTKTDRLLGDVTALDNLALFLAQLDIDKQSNWIEYIDYYLNSRKIISNLDNIKKYIIITAQNKLKIRLNNFARKCQRESSLFQKVSVNEDSSYHGVKIRDSYSNDKDSINKTLPSHNHIDDLVDAFISSPQEFINKYQIKLLKDGNTANISLIEYKNIKFIVKHYLPKNILMTIVANIKYLFVKPRALLSWVNSSLLTHIGVNTARPIAVICKTKFNLVTESYFIMEYIDDFVRLSDILADHNLKDNNKYISDVKKILSYFKILKIVHRDFKTVNIGFSDNKITILDLDDMQIYNHDLFYNRLKNRDLNRLLKCFNSEQIKSYLD